MCLCRLKLWKGSNLVNIERGWVKNIIYVDKMSVGMVIGSRLFGLINSFSIRNMVICVSQVRLLKFCRML